MKEICKRIAVVIAIMFIALGGCISCTGDKDWWLCLIPSAVGLLILLSVQIAEKIENKRSNKDTIMVSDKYIIIKTSQGNEYKITKKKSDFEELFEKHSKE